MTNSAPSDKPRLRDWGICPGVLPAGPLNAITDVGGVRVGQVTLIEGDEVRTGVTAILPHGGNLYRDKVPAGFEIGNGYGKMMGVSQILELGEIETPILLTNTNCVQRAADAILTWTFDYPGNEDVISVNAVVGETNDSWVNDIRRRAVTPDHGLEAIAKASVGAVAEGSVGAGTGTSAFGWKGGIGTSARLLPEELGGFAVGALVQSNYGGVLQVMGAPVGKELGNYYLRQFADDGSARGSIMMVVATDAPLSDRNLHRLARRSMAGLARTGSSMGNHSGDYAIAFSTAEGVRRTAERRDRSGPVEELPNGLMDPLFQAAIEATEEAIYNSLFRATTITGYRGRTLGELPLDEVKRILIQYGVAAG